MSTTFIPTHSFLLVHIGEAGFPGASVCDAESLGGQSLLGVELVQRHGGVRHVARLVDAVAVGAAADGGKSRDGGVLRSKVNGSGNAALDEEGVVANSERNRRSNGRLSQFGESEHCPYERMYSQPNTEPTTGKRLYML